MGGVTSQPAFRRSSSKNQSTGPTLRRSSKNRQSKVERANVISVSIQNIRGQIDDFDGFRGDSRYQSIQTDLTKFSQEIQEVKTKAKPPTKDLCSNIQADIVDLLRRLEEIVEKNENDLDSGAVESHSFINQTPSLSKKIVTAIQERDLMERDRQMMELSKLEENTSNLMKEINRAIELQNTSEFVVFEKKIGILYADLTTMDIEKGDTLFERSESISRKLIRYNNKIKSAKNRPLSHVENKEEKAKKVEQELDIINLIEEELGDLEIKVTLFEDVKNDPKYRELDQALKGAWAKLQSLEDSSEENRRKKLKAINLIKKTLQTLNSKAEENNAKMKPTLDKIKNIEEEVSVLKVVVDDYQGYKNSPDYTNLDQTIRTLWAKLNDIHSPYGKIETKKTEIIKTIQEMLKNLLQNSEKYESRVASREKLSSHITSGAKSKKDTNLTSIQSLQNQWDSLKIYLDDNLSSDNKNEIENTLIKLRNDLDRYIKDIPNKFADNRANFQRGSNQNLAQNRVNRSSVVNLKYKDDKIKNKAVSQENLKSGYSQENLNKLAKSTVSQDNLKSGYSQETLSKLAKSPTSQDNLNRVTYINLNQEHLYNKPQEQLVQELSNFVEPSTSKQTNSQENFEKLEKIAKRLKIILDEINASTNHNSELRDKLGKVEDNLNKIDDSLNPQIVETKAEIAKNIKEGYNLLEERAKKDANKEETAKLKAIVENLQKIKKKVDCFSGTHGNIQFMQIQKELNDSMMALEDINCKDNEKLSNNKKQISQKISHYLNILDERSLKVNSQEDLIATVEKEEFLRSINKLVDVLTEIRSKLEQYEINKANNFEKDFEESKKMLNSITPITEEDTKNKEYYREYLNQLVIYYQSKLEETPLQNLGKAIKELKSEAIELDNAVIDNQNLNQRISSALTQIRKISAASEAEEAEKAKFMQIIKTIGGLLQTKESILKDLDKILVEIENFSGPNYRKNYDMIDEKLSAIFLKIGQIPVNEDPDFGELKNNFIKKVQTFKKLLNNKMDKVKEFDSDPEGTEV